MKPSIVALIPARAGSKRIPGKNTRLLAGHPLIAYTIAAAQESGIFSLVLVSTDDEHIAQLARHYKDESRTYRAVIRPSEFATDDSPDIRWVRHALGVAEKWCENYNKPQPDAFAILRPTSPFRSAETIRHAWEKFKRIQPADSLRAIRRVSDHPGKMWRLTDETYNGVPRTMMDTLLREADTVDIREAGEPPWHSRPTQTLPPYYVQTGALEIAWTATVTQKHSISGDYVAPYITEGNIAIDLNTEADWREAERLIASGEATLPPVPVARVQTALTEK